MKEYTVELECKGVSLKVVVEFSTNAVVPEDDRERLAIDKVVKLTGDDRREVRVIRSYSS